MTNQHVVRLVLVVFSMTGIGCSSKSAVTSNPLSTSSSSKNEPAERPIASLDSLLTLQEPTVDDKYRGALLDSLILVTNRQYSESLDALKKAQAAKDCEEVRHQITRVQGLMLDREVFERVIADLQILIHLGRGEEAGQQINQGMALFTDAAEFEKLASLKRQAEAFIAIKSPDGGKAVERLRQEGDAAIKVANLRAALLAYELALALKSDSSLQKQVESLRFRINQYDIAMEHAREFCRNSQTIEEAISAYQEAEKTWNTTQVQNELTDAKLALKHRRERIAVAAFETHGDVQSIPYSSTFADALLQHFQGRFDLIERRRIDHLFSELKIAPSEVGIGEQGRVELSRLAKARYLVTGRISTLAGTTIHARLIDLAAGLIVQTGSITAPTADEALRKLPQLAAILMLSDEEKLAYEQQISQMEQVPAPTAAVKTSQLPVYDAKAPPTPIYFNTTRVPAFGALQSDEYDRFPATASDFAALNQVSIEQERPLRLKLLAIQLELGDNLFKRGRHQEALKRYQSARELDPSNIDILSRMTLCRQYLPPVPAPEQSDRKERMAVLSFFVGGNQQLVRLGLSTWVPNQLGVYYGAACEVIDSGEAYWMMDRLGLSLDDVLRDAAARRWLGRALDVRYFVVGRLVQSSDIAVTASILDAEQGWEVGRGQAIVGDLHELKLCLPEIARMSMLDATQRSQKEKQLSEHEAEYLRAQEAYQRGNFTLALELAKKLRLAHPFNARFGFFEKQCEEQVLQESLAQTGTLEIEQRSLADQAMRRQVEFTLALQRARDEAIQGAGQATEADRERVHQMLLAQARRELGSNNLVVAMQLFDGALSLRASDEKLRGELVHLRSRVEADRNRQWVTEQQQRAEAARRQEDLGFAGGRQLWTNDRQKFQTQLTLLNAQRLRDVSDYSRLLDQARQMKSQGRFDQAALLLQSARRMKPGEESERLLAEALVEQARTQAKAEDATRFAELERRLAQETTKRKQAEQEALRNWAQYLTAMQQGRELQRSKQYEPAIGKYKEAIHLFGTLEAATNLQFCLFEVTRVRELVEAVKRAEQVKSQRATELARCLADAKALEQTKKYDDALLCLRRAKRLATDQNEVLEAISRIEWVRLKAIEHQNAALARDQAAKLKMMLAEAEKRALAKQYAAALALLEAAQKSGPADQEVTAQLSTVKKMQAANAEALMTMRKTEEESRRQVALKIQGEEKAKQLAASAKQQAETALGAGDLKAAESALVNATKLAPKDPTIIKLKQELAKAQGQARRQQVQADAKVKLEAAAQARQLTVNRENQGQLGQLLQQAQAAIAKKDFSSAEKLIGDALALDPTNLAAGRAQRELQAARQAEARAKAAMSTADKKKQEEEQGKKKAEFARLMKEGKEALASEDLERAAKLFTQAKALNPEDADAALFLGMAKRDSERAKAEADAAKKEAEANAKRETEEAKAEAESKKKSEEELRRRLAMDAEAKKKADALKELNKQQFEGALFSGKQALEAKRYDDAIKAFEKALQLVPDDKSVTTLLHQAQKLKAEGSKPVPEKASVEQLVSRASQLQSQKKWDEALKHYRQALGMNPNDQAAKNGATLCEVQIHLEAGVQALSKQDKEGAIKNLEAALKLVPGHAEAVKLLKQARELK